jgi:lysozyme family protein
MAWLINLIKAILGTPKMNDITPPTVPPVPPVSPATPSPLIPKAFEDALALVLKVEGGYVNNPNDHGGATNKGIIQREYDRYRTDKSLPLQSVRYISDDEVREIYHDDYWMAGKCEEMPYGISILHFDSCVNCGVKQSAKFLQRAAGCTADGIVGTQTLAAVHQYVKAYSEPLLINAYLNQRSEFYYYLIDKDPSQRVFIKGWQNRLKQLGDYLHVSA